MRIRQILEDKRLLVSEATGRPLNAWVMVDGQPQAQPRGLILEDDGTSSNMRLVEMMVDGGTRVIFDYCSAREMLAFLEGMLRALYHEAPPLEPRKIRVSDGEAALIAEWYMGDFAIGRFICPDCGAYPGHQCSDQLGPKLYARWNRIALLTDAEKRTFVRKVEAMRRS